MISEVINLKKILIGICGIGNGHINRQICVINEILKKDYQILIKLKKKQLSRKVNWDKQGIKGSNWVKSNLREIVYFNESNLYEDDIYIYIYI